MGLPKQRRRSRSQALPPRTAGAGYVGAGTQVVTGHFRSPGALPTDLPCHGRHLRHRGCPGQPNPDWRPPAPDGGAPSFLPPSTSHSPDLIEGLTLDWGSLPGSLTQEACWHLVSAPKEPPACPASG